ncbi:MAG: hypothetical protein QOE92_2059 [Chloroflexota bacterium]|nr:hypothetical protein [Chloroflexota bacterium]
MKPFQVQDLQFFAVSVVVTAVIVGLLYMVRRAMQGQAWKDFLGITMTFFVLVEAAAIMILGENFAG